MLSQEKDHLDRRAPLILVGGTIVCVVLGLVLVLIVGAWSAADFSGKRGSGGGRRRPLPAASAVGSRLAGQQAWLFERRDHREPRALPAALTEYGWTDRERGLVHIPLARARELYIERAASRDGGPTR